MTFLELCRRAHLILRFDEAAPGTAPETVAAQTGKLGELVQWIQAAYADIQNYRTDWLFLRKQGSFTVASGDPTTLAAIQADIADYQALKPSEDGAHNRFILIHADGVADQTPVWFVPYEQWRMDPVHDAGTRPTGRPHRFTILPNGDLDFDADRDQAYTLTFDYVRTQHTLSADGDEPILPAESHQAIVWWAIVNYYCVSRDKTEALQQKAGVALRREMNKLGLTQLPEFGIGA